jgi:hypothetical protein
MSTETVMDMSFDTSTALPEDFTCSCQILILSPHLTELPQKFLSNNVHVKTLDMSKCNVTEIPDYFCENSIITNLILPTSLCIIHNVFLYSNKTLTYLDISYCIHLEYIGLGFCDRTIIAYIKFPKSLRCIDNYLCHFSENLQELDFSECENLTMNVECLSAQCIKLYSINNIGRIIFIFCTDIHIYNVIPGEIINFEYVEYIVNVYLPEGKYCIQGNYPDVTFWLLGHVFPIDYFRELKWHTLLPVCEPILLDVQLENV